MINWIPVGAVVIGIKTPFGEFAMTYSAIESPSAEIAVFIVMFATDVTAKYLSPSFHIPGKKCLSW